MTTKFLIRELLMRFLTPIVSYVGKIKSPWSHKKAISDFYTILGTLKPLDIILTNTYGHLSNLMNPGPWKHALIYIGEENGVPMIIEAIGEGVLKRTLVECIAEKDSVAIVRVNQNIVPAKQNKAIKWAHNQLGKHYDHSFDMRSVNKLESFFCSELCFFVLKEAGININFELRQTVVGYPTVVPSDFYYAAKSKKMKILFETASKKTKVKK